MPLRRRPDGFLVRGAPPMRHMLPTLMPARSESLVYLDLSIEVEGTLAYIERQGRNGSGERVTLFQIILCAAARTLALRPQLDRFVAGRRLYQRHAIELSFAVKKAFTDDGRLTTVKVRFDPRDALSLASRRIREVVQLGKADAEGKSDLRMRAVSRFPRSPVRLLLGAQRTLDYFNLLPAGTIRSDPLYSSMFLANLGSVGVDAYHHLYEYGTVPIFGTIGRVKKAPVVDEHDNVVARCWRRDGPSTSASPMASTARATSSCFVPWWSPRSFSSDHPTSSSRTAAALAATDGQAGSGHRGLIHG